MASSRRQGGRWALQPQSLGGQSGPPQAWCAMLPPSPSASETALGPARGSPGFAVPRELRAAGRGQSRRHSETHTAALEASLRCSPHGPAEWHCPHPADKGRFVQGASLGTVTWSPSSGWVSAASPGIPRAPTVAPTRSLKPPGSPETFGGARPRAFRSLEEKGTHMSPRACAHGSQRLCSEPCVGRASGGRWGKCHP